MNREITPLQDRVLARRLEAVSEVGGIVVPEQAREVPLEAKIISVGPAVTTLAPGDHILIGRYSGSPVTVEGIEYLLIRLDECFAKITPVRVEE